MSQYVETGTRAFVAGAALAPHLRVKLTAGKLALAGASDVELGTMETRSYADLDPATVRLRTAEGTAKMVASGAISAGANVYAAASGKVAASGTVLVGTALEAATADNDVIEVLRRAETSDFTGIDDATVTFTNKTIRTLTAAVVAAGSAQGDAAALTEDALNSVSGADGVKGVVLPVAAAGKRCRVYNEHATAGLKIYPASGDSINGGSVDAAITIEGKTLALFECFDGTNWAAIFTVNV